LQKDPEYRFEGGYIETSKDVYVRAGGSYVQTLVKRVDYGRCFICGRPIRGEKAVVVIHGELYEKHPKHGRPGKRELVWIEDELYYHPNCYYKSPNAHKRTLDVFLY